MTDIAISLEAICPTTGEFCAFRQGIIALSNDSRVDQQAVVAAAERDARFERSVVGRVAIAINPLIEWVYTTASGRPLPPTHAESIQELQRAIERYRNALDAPCTDSAANCGTRVYTEQHPSQPDLQ